MRADFKRAGKLVNGSSRRPALFSSSSHDHPADCCSVVRELCRWLLRLSPGCSPGMREVVFSFFPPGGGFFSDCSVFCCRVALCIPGVPSDLSDRSAPSDLEYSSTPDCVVFCAGKPGWFYCCRVALCILLHLSDLSDRSDTSDLEYSSTPSFMRQL